MDLSAPWPVRTISIKKLKPKRILILLFMQSVDTARGCMDNLCSVYLLLRVSVDFKGFQNQMFHDDILLPNCESYIVIWYEIVTLICVNISEVLYRIIRSVMNLLLCKPIIGNMFLGLIGRNERAARLHKHSETLTREVQETMKSNVWITPKKSNKNQTKGTYNPSKNHLKQSDKFLIETSSVILFRCW